MVEEVPSTTYYLRPASTRMRGFSGMSTKMNAFDYFMTIVFDLTNSEDAMAEDPSRAIAGVLPFGVARADDLLQPFCACGHVRSACDRSRAGCTRVPR